jgi:glutamine amidotransferase
MCLLVVCNPNSTPSKDELTTGACKNPHGFGFAIDTGAGIISERSMSAKKSIARFLELREQYPNGYAMWHARYATHGVKNELNCHPFKVVGEHDTYLAHNGVLDIHIPKGDKRSDTRIMAEELLPRLGGVSALDDDYVYDMISAWASGSKVAVMTNDPSAQYKIYIINENLGSWDDKGIWWSNASYKPTISTPRTESYNYTYGDEPSVYDIVVQEDSGFDYHKFECPNCMAIVDLYESELYCLICECCFDCSAQFLDCLCYNPNAKSMIRDEYGFLSEKWYSKEPLDF